MVLNEVLHHGGAALCFGVRMENLDFTRVFDLHGIFPIKRIEEKLKFTIWIYYMKNINR